MPRPRASASFPEPQGQTAMMRQYLAAKQKHPDKLLLFRMGDFYELFYEDAIEAARLLSLTLTSRTADKVTGERIPMAGVPVHALEGYLRKLVAMGLRVAICDQVEDPRKAKGLVRREITRVVTPGTLMEEGLLEPARPNYLAALAPGASGAGYRKKPPPEKMLGVAYCDLSTGEFFVNVVPAARVRDELGRIGPAECLVPQGEYENRGAESFLGAEAPAGAEATDSRAASSAPPCAFTPLPEWAFDPQTATQVLLERFGRGPLGRILEEPLMLSAAGAVLGYLEETQPEGTPHLRAPRPVSDQEHLLLDATTIRNLELVETQRWRSRKGTLLAVLDATCTPLGARRLRQWLLRPLARLDPIVARQEAVAALVAEPALRAAVREALAGVHDLERLQARISAGRGNARDLLGVGRSLDSLPQFSALLAQFGDRPHAPASDLASAPCLLLSAIAERLSSPPGLAPRILATLVDDPPLTITEGGMVRDGVDQELDRLRAVKSHGVDWLARFQKQQQERTGIPNLKVGFNKVFGYYLEVTRSRGSRVPEDYERKQTLVGAERYVTAELKQYESEVLGAEEKTQALEERIFRDLREEAARHTARIQDIAEALADLDALCALAEVAQQNGYVRPQMSDEAEIEITEGRHPTLEKTLPPGAFVANDLRLGTEAQILLITGPNMAGKSTYIRQAALLVLLAQMGSFVPARSARIGLVDQLFTRIGAVDDLTGGQSTFMVEMAETAYLLHHATGRSMVILDEVGRGTSTYDGLSLAWAITEYLHDTSGARARTLFATHYHELTELAGLLERVKNYNVAVREWNGEVSFLYRILPGATDRSYGLYVARLAGVPQEVIERAKEILSRLETAALNADRSIGRVPYGTRERRRRLSPQLSLFRMDPPTEVERLVLDTLKAIDVNHLTPVEALGRLQELSGRLWGADGKGKGEKDENHDQDAARGGDRPRRGSAEPDGRLRRPAGGADSGPLGS